jgi:hypothetical protein
VDHGKFYLTNINAGASLKLLDVEAKVRRLCTLAHKDRDLELKVASDEVSMEMG